MKPAALVLLGTVGAIAATAPAASAQTFVNPSLAARLVPTAALPGAPPAGRTNLAQQMNLGHAGGAQGVVNDWRAAAEWASAHPDEFRVAVDSATHNPKYAQEHARDVEFVVVGMAATASNPIEWDDQLGGVTGAQRDSVIAFQDQLERRLRRVRVFLAGYPVAILATGTAVESAGDPADAHDDGKKPLGTGSLGVLVGTPAGRFMARVNIVSTDAIAPADFGPAVLTPGSGSSLSSGVLDWRTQWRGPNHFYVAGSAIRLRSADKDSVVARASVLAAGALFARDLFDQPFLNTHVALSVEAGLALRLLDGDVGQDTTHFGELFKDGRNVAFGPEAGFSVSFGRLTAAAQMYVLSNSGKDIPGLTRPQFIAGLSVSGELIGDRLRWARHPDRSEGYRARHPQGKGT